MADLDRDELSEYLRAVRSLALLAERSAELVGLTLAQMRLLFTVSDLGEGSCSAVAAQIARQCVVSDQADRPADDVRIGLANSKSGQRLRREFGIDRRGRFDRAPRHCAP